MTNRNSQQKHRTHGINEWQTEIVVRTNGTTWLSDDDSTWKLALNLHKHFLSTLGCYLKHFTSLLYKYLMFFIVCSWCNIKSYLPTYVFTYLMEEKKD